LSIIRRHFYLHRFVYRDIRFGISRAPFAIEAIVRKEAVLDFAGANGRPELSGPLSRQKKLIVNTKSLFCMMTLLVYYLVCRLVPSSVQN